MNFSKSPIEPRDTREGIKFSDSGSRIKGRFYIF